MQTLLNSRWKYLLSVVLLLVSAYMLTLILISSQNNLHKNSFWFPYQSKFYGMLNGGIESLVSRQPVAGGKLRSHHQRVFSKEYMTPKKIEFKFRLNHLGTFVDIIFNADQESYEAVRISTQDAKPFFHYKSMHTGQYLWKKEFKTNPQITTAITASLEQKDKNLVLTLGDRTFPVESSFKNGQVGFDLSYNTSIWDPIITKDNGEIIKAPFTAPENTLRIFVFNLAVIIIVSSLLAAIVPLKDKFVRIPLIMTSLLGLFYLFDEFYYSRKVFLFDARSFMFVEIDPGDFDYEKYRYIFMRKWYEMTGGTLDDREKHYTKVMGFDRDTHRFCTMQDCDTVQNKPISQKGPNTIRIMVWGGSFSVGSGLEDPRQSYPEILHAKLIEKYGSKYKIETLNASNLIAGFELRKEVFIDDLNKFTPDIVIIDAMFNQSNIQEYDKFIREISKSVPYIVVTRYPLNSDAHTSVARKDFYEILKRAPKPVPDNGMEIIRQDHIIYEWTKSMNVQFVDPNIYLLSDDVYLNGQVFWDLIHVTAYAHEKWAHYIFHELTPAIENQILK